MIIPGNTPPFMPMEHGGALGYEAHYELSRSMYVTQYHCHDYYELYLHLRGGDYMGLDDSLYELKPNQIFIIPPFHMHGLSCTREMHNYERSFLNLSPEVMQVLGCGQIDLDHFLRTHVSKGHCTYQLSDENAAVFVRNMQEIRADQKTDRSAVSRFRNYARIMTVLDMICQLVDRESPEESGTASNTIIQDVLSWINEHYTEPLTVHSLALRFNISDSYLSHEFARFTSRSVYDYILYRRVMLSCQMMMNEDSLNSIAYQCGFNDYSNFLRSFSRVMGVSPSSYRKHRQQYRIS